MSRRPIRFALVALSGLALLVASRLGSTGEPVLASETPARTAPAGVPALADPLIPAWEAWEADALPEEEARATELLETLLLPEASDGAPVQRTRWADARDLQDLLQIEAQLDAWRLRLLAAPRTIS
jgi:hypothetical protein